ncbi:MAG: 4Fe-4S dicluster domain-containing protein [Deltaproteobacteria bacterium]|nr:MAG: 4Fe-4S dicluster domain-containing protein [Deltaproteobacteria bacterium]
MDFGYFAEGPLLWIVFLLFIVAIIIRLGFFVYQIAANSSDRRFRWGYIPATFGRLFVPFHMAVIKKPLYGALRYVFHVCLFVVPIWLSGHIVLWAESRFEWDWTPLPDAWADWMTLIVLTFALYFLVRHIVLKDVRLATSASDYVIVILTALPFLTGYFLTHGTMDSIAFLGDNMRTIHVLSAEAMIIMAAFLFCRTRLNVRTCTGCAACEIACPTNTLESTDRKDHRIFTYSHYQCICCGACVGTCPEGAAALRHEISARLFFQIVPKKEIRSVELKACERCGALFAPTPQLEKVGQTITDDYLRFCPQCKKITIAEVYYKLSPWQRPLKKEFESTLIGHQQDAISDTAAPAQKSSTL